MDTASFFLILIFFKISNPKPFRNTSNFSKFKIFKISFFNVFFQNLKFKKLLDQFYYVLQGDSGIERILERWKREKEESIET